MNVAVDSGGVIPFRTKYGKVNPQIRAMGRALERRVEGSTTIGTLRSEFGDNAGIAKAMGLTPGTRDYKSTMRSLQRLGTSATEKRGIGPVLRKRLSSIAPPISKRSNVKIVIENEESTYEYVGGVKVERRTRHIQAAVITGESDIAKAFADPLTAFLDHHQLPAFDGEAHIFLEYSDDDPEGDTISDPDLHEYDGDVHYNEDF